MVVTAWLWIFNFHVEDSNVTAYSSSFISPTTPITIFYWCGRGDEHYIATRVRTRYRLPGLDEFQIFSKQNSFGFPALDSPQLFVGDSMFVFGRAL